MKAPQKTTRRLLIRAFRAGDYRKYREAYLNLLPAQNIWDQGPSVAKQLSRASFRKMLRLHILRRKMDRLYAFGVFEKNTGTLVGMVGMMDVVRSLSHTAFLGYNILNPHWGKGYGKEAVDAVIRLAFKDLKLHRIEAGIEPQNRRSIMLARTLGLRKEGLKKRAVFLRKKWVDLVMYSATCEEFGIRWKIKK